MLIQRRWWLINQGEDVELCLEEPGFEVAIYASATLRDMIRMWRGDLAVDDAIDAGRLELHGPRGARRRFVAWFGISTLAHVAPAAS